MSDDVDACALVSMSCSSKCGKRHVKMATTGRVALLEIEGRHRVLTAISSGHVPRGWGTRCEQTGWSARRKRGRRQAPAAAASPLHLPLNRPRRP